MVTASTRTQRRRADRFSSRPFGSPGAGGETQSRVSTLARGRMTGLPQNASVPPPGLFGSLVIDDLPRGHWEQRAHASPMMGAPHGCPASHPGPSVSQHPENTRPTSAAVSSQSHVLVSVVE